jgi:putative nucleotidyltransferase with HDIG domain
VGQKISGSPFNKENINLVSIVTNQAAFLMEQSQASNDFQEVYFKTIRALTKALEAKYVFARGHNIRTANYANIVAKRMGISNGDIKDLTYGSLLHDIGKIAIKDEYLLNPHHFSDTEAGLKNKILEHTIKGASILKSAGFDEPIVDLALHHHELYNGKGYPHRLGEEDISRPARILVVCNTYDAMTSDRPHRKAHPESTAKEYLRAHAGSLFDPDAVKAFLSEIGINKEMYKYH